MPAAMCKWLRPHQSRTRMIDLTPPSHARVAAPPPTGVALLVEDEAQIRRFVRTALQSEGWQVHEAATLQQGLMEAGTRSPDLIILDLGLPDGDGVGFLRELRTWSKTTVIVLSARADESDKVLALDAGADDYMPKPFGVPELLARVRANMRRVQQRGGSGEDKPSTCVFGDVRVDLAARLVEKAGREIHLTPTEFQLLATLIASAGRVLTHRQLLHAVWGPSFGDSTHYLRVYMGHLRQKLEDDPAQPKFLKTETAVGYRLHLG